MVAQTQQTTVKSGYKKTEVGIIPTDWDVLTLKDVCSSITDGTHFTPKYVRDGIPFYSVENVTGNNFSDVKFISEKEHNILIRRCKPEQNNILLTRIGSLGETKLLDWKTNASIYVSLALLKVDPKKIDIGFLYSHTKSDQFKHSIKKKSLTNATPQKINLQEIGKVPLPVPKGKNEQVAIATHILDIIELIKNLDKLIEKKKNIKQGTMQELLTGKKRLSGFSGKWELKDLKELGCLDPENLSNSTEGEYVFDYISIDDVDHGFLKSHTELKFKNAPSRARRKLRYNDILISTVRPNLKSHLLIQIKSNDLVCSTGFSVLRCFEQTDPRFVYFHIFAHTISSQIESILIGSNYPSINRTEVGKLIITIPPTKKEQSAIAQVLSDMDSEIEEFENKRDKYLMIKRGMMQKLLTGAIRLH